MSRPAHLLFLINRALLVLIALALLTGLLIDQWQVVLRYARLL